MNYEKEKRKRDDKLLPTWKAGCILLFPYVLAFIIIAWVMKIGWYYLAAVDFCDQDDRKDQ